MSDENKITILTQRFFNLFTNTDNQILNVDDLRNFFLPEGIIINNTTGEPSVYNLDSFIQPRKELLTNGTLVDFWEREIASETKIHKNIASRICQYEKAGILNGEPFKGYGLKMMHFVKVNEDWFLSSVNWTDHR